MNRTLVVGKNSFIGSHLKSYDSVEYKNLRNIKLNNINFDQIFISLGEQLSSINNIQ